VVIPDDNSTNNNPPPPPGGVFLHLSTTFDLPISFITFPDVNGKYKTPVGGQDTGGKAAAVSWTVLNFKAATNNRIAKVCKDRITWYKVRHG
jgi:hypothetical protein